MDQATMERAKAVASQAIRKGCAVAVKRELFRVQKINEEGAQAVPLSDWVSIEQVESIVSRI